MQRYEELTNEIHGVLDELEQRRDPWVASWIAHHILESHDTGVYESREDEAFWHHTSYETVRKHVTQAINKRAGDRDVPDDGQVMLPGWERLQSYYVVERDGNQVGLPVWDLTDDELDSKASLFRSFANANMRHAEEIERFKAIRRRSATA